MSQVPLFSPKDELLLREYKLIQTQLAKPAARVHELVDEISCAVMDEISDENARLRRSFRIAACAAAGFGGAFWTAMNWIWWVK